MRRGDLWEYGEPFPRKPTEEEMIVPHPNHVIIHLEQRHADYLAECSQEQRARLAERTSRAPSPLRWADLLASLFAVVVLALLVAAGAEAFITPSAASPLVTIVLP